jgi:hypothetical protein
MVTPAGGADFDQSHTLLDRTLKIHVQDRLVAYAALKANSTNLDEYLNQCAAVSKTDYGKWPEPQRLAFCINLYNASTLRLILDHYPVKSVKKIGGWFSGPWEEPAVRLFGQTTTLDHLEHKMMRVEFNEPRLHFAIVCAARGCPPLRNEAYTAEKLEVQLADQGRSFLVDPTKNRVELKTGVVYLSPIFKWFEEDFARDAGTVLKFIAPYFPADVKRELNQGNLRIKYTDYDWSLNDAKANVSGK